MTTIGSQALHTPTEAAKLLRVSTRTIYRMIDAGTIRRADMPGVDRMLIPQSEIDRVSQPVAK